ncbi:hypothetical protein F5J12DRAFT_905722 [Pisolithus orientalis]|uniref:uncharacterized protein n=1 Tax=Pisolithus orientalis TaxID=936130 RepID=UPI0022249CDF|nr:uncharacterized protein F5J12DRAFT_905722 [Pisolithus orientalis]KAI6006188.1 hypothetical protein F5J12DRAFT_905722 [Pisolithus orientalis]
MDDVSGNISKRWNKHHVVYMSNASMPREMVEKEFCICFVTSSPHATPLELMNGVSKSVRKTMEEGVITWDCKYKTEVMLIAYNVFIAGDNPMQAEEFSHAGLHCNYFCRTCNVGGTNQEKMSDSGYMNLFEVPLAEIKKQVELAKLPGGTEKLKSAVASSGICDPVSMSIIDCLLELGKQLRKCKAGVPAKPEAEVQVQLEKEFELALGGLSLDDHINPLLGMPGVNIHQDTPTEILHTILLGIAWLESINKDGLNSPTLGAEYICHYKGGLIGKHFKSLAQVMPYLIYDLVPQHVLDGWTVIGELIVLLWHTAIDDVDEYLVSALMH